MGRLPVILLQWLRYLGVISEQDKVADVKEHFDVMQNKLLSDPDVQKQLTALNGSASIKPPLSHNFQPVSLGKDLDLVTKTGRLRVFIAPSPVTIKGAKWRRVGTTVWFDSGDTEPFVPVGHHDLEYQNVPSYAPPSTNVTIKDKEVTEVVVTYTYISTKGHLTINLIPDEIESLGGGWRRKGTDTWLAGGYQEKNLEAGNYIIEFKDSAPYFEPLEATVQVSAMIDRTYSFEYELIPTKGSLKVTMTPDQALTDGAKWRRKGTTIWLSSGDTENNILIGSHEVEFFQINGYNPVSDVPVEIMAEQLTEITKPYIIIPTKGSLKVHLQPNEIHETLGGKWRRQGTLPWFLHGETEEDVLQGTYTIEVPSIFEWDNPPVTEATIVPEQLTALTLNYTYHPILGNLQITLSPQGAINNGAKWRVSGSSSWNDSGAIISDLEEGDYTIEFNTVPEYTAPTGMIVTVIPDTTVGVVGAYTWAPTVGSLKVIISPAAAVTAGCKWRRALTTTWLDSGFIEDNLPGGTYGIEVLNPDLNLLVTPSVIPSVLIVNGQVTELHITFGVVGTATVIEEGLRVVLNSLDKVMRRVPPATCTITILGASIGDVDAITKKVPYRTPSTTFTVLSGYKLKSSSLSANSGQLNLIVSGNTITTGMVKEDSTITLSEELIPIIKESADITMTFDKAKRKDAITKIIIPEVDSLKLGNLNFLNAKRKQSILTPTEIISEPKEASPILTFQGITKIVRKNSIIIP